MKRLHNQQKQLNSALRRFQNSSHTLLSKLYRDEQLDQAISLRFDGISQDITACSRIISENISIREKLGKKLFTITNTKFPNRRELREHEYHNYCGLVGLKFFLICTRSFQDILYSLVRHYLNQKEEIGLKWSMQYIETRAHDPVAKILIDEFPNYRDWFSSIRDARNEIKLGTKMGIAYNQPMDTFSLSFTIILEPEKIKQFQRYTRNRNLNINELITGLEYSTKLIKLILQIIKKQITSSSEVSF